MFIKNSERKGSAYIEFSYLKNEVKSRKLYKKLPNFSEDSILIYVDAIDEFYSKFHNVFDYESYDFRGNKYELEITGVQFYFASQIPKFIMKIIDIECDDKKILIDWLEYCHKNYFGFYIIGI